MKRYGYGIVDRHGKPWWAEDCVCQDREPLVDIVVNLLNEPCVGLDAIRQPYRVVRLMFETRKRRRK